MRNVETRRRSLLVQPRFKLSSPPSWRLECRSVTITCRVAAASDAGDRNGVLTCKKLIICVAVARRVGRYAFRSAGRAAAGILGAHGGPGRAFAAARRPGRRAKRFIAGSEPPADPRPESRAKKLKPRGATVLSCHCSRRSVTPTSLPALLSLSTLRMPLIAARLPGDAIFTCAPQSLRGFCPRSRQRTRGSSRPFCRTGRSASPGCRKPRQPLQARRRRP